MKKYPAYITSTQWKSFHEIITNPGSIYLPTVKTVFFIASLFSFFFNSWWSRPLQYLQDNALYLRTGQASATPGFLESLVTKDMFINFKTEKLLVSHALWPKSISTFLDRTLKIHLCAYTTLYFLYLLSSFTPFRLPFSAA